MDHVTHFSLDVCIVKDLLVTASGVNINVIISDIPLLSTVGTTAAGKVTCSTTVIAAHTVASWLFALPIFVMKTIKYAFVELFLPHRSNLLFLKSASVLEICQRCLDGLWTTLAVLSV